MKGRVRGLGTAKHVGLAHGATFVQSGVEKKMDVSLNMDSQVLSFRLSRQTSPPSVVCGQ